MGLEGGGGGEGGGAGVGDECCGVLVGDECARLLLRVEGTGLLVWVEGGVRLVWVEGSRLLVGVKCAGLLVWIESARLIVWVEWGGSEWHVGLPPAVRLDACYDEEGDMEGSIKDGLVDISCIVESEYRTLQLYQGSQEQYQTKGTRHRNYTYQTI